MYTLQTKFRTKFSILNIYNYNFEFSTSILVAVKYLGAGGPFEFEFDSWYSLDPLDFPIHVVFRFDQNCHNSAKNDTHDSKTRQKDASRKSLQFAKEIRLQTQSLHIDEVMATFVFKFFGFEIENGRLATL